MITTERSKCVLAAATIAIITSACATTQTSPNPQNALSSPAIYQVSARDFSPADNGNGMIAGLDRIQASGAGVIWLMPNQPTDDFRHLMDEVHRRGMKLVIDGTPAMDDVGFDLAHGRDSYGTLKAVWQGEPAASFVEREMQEKLPGNARRLRFTTSHDETEPPPVLFGGAAGARAAFIATAFLPGVPMLYNGQEVETSNGADARAFYRRVLDLATSHPAFTGGELQPVITDAPADVISYTRGDVVILVNTRPREITVNVHGKLLDGSRDLISGNTHSGSIVKLSPYGTAVLDPMGRCGDGWLLCR
jgi:glycosidase